MQSMETPVDLFNDEAIDDELQPPSANDLSSFFFFDESGSKAPL